MNDRFSQIRSWVATSLAALAAGLLFTACQTTSESRNAGVFPDDPAAAAPAAPTTPGGAPPPAPVPGGGLSDRLRVNETLQVIFSDAAVDTRPFEGRIKEDGTITLMQNQVFVAAGKTIGELEKDIYNRYVPKYYVNLTVTVRAQDRYFYVGGQVRMPSRLEWRGDITLLGAIAAAGGLTDFAKQSKVQILRANNTKVTIDFKKLRQGHPELDVPIYPGDRIIVDKKFW